MQVHLTLKSANVKTGPIPVSTTTKDSCPADCGMRAECYAASGPLALHWAKVTAGERGTDWPTFVAQIAQLPDGQLWRHNQAGDLPVAGGTVDAVKLGQLVHANAGRRGQEELARARYARARALCIELGYEAQQMVAEAGLAQRLLSAGQVEDARQHLLAALRSSSL
jgi:hypothetical protein